uniref:glycerol kinase n=1 Tax=Anopheles culicifacies TaxID=139723 RepID=A0A182LY18_9DIPT
MASLERSKLIGVIAADTNSARFVIFKLPDFEEIASHQIRITQIVPKDGWSEHNPVEVLEAVRLCAVEACHQVEKLGYLVKDIAAIGITNQRETTVVWDKNTGEPLYNAIVWNDIRTDKTVDRVLARLPEQNHNHFRALSGLPISPYFSALKLNWLKDNVVAVRKACREKRCYAGTIDTWLVWNLTGGPQGGAFVTDVTNASRTLLMNIETLHWDPLLTKTFSVHPDMLPEIRSSSEIYGKVKDNSVLDGIPISAILGNQQASLIGQQCLKEGQAKNSYRKGCFLLYNTGTRCVQSTHGLVTTVAYQLGRNAPPVYALEGSVAVAGVAMNWLRDNLKIIKDIKDSEQIAGSVSSTGDVYFVPAFTGLYAPYWRKDARGIFCGLTSFTTKHHFVRAALEAVCYQTRDILEAMKKDCGINLNKLHADGSMASNNLLMQLQADLSGIPVLRTEVHEPAALGTAMAAAQAKGVELYKLEAEIRGYAGVQSHHETFLPTTTEEERNARYTKWKMAVQRSLGWAVSKKSEAMTECEGIRAKFANYETKFINDFINFTRPAGDIMEPIYYDYDGGTKTSDYETGMTLGGLPIPEETPGRLATKNGEVTRPPDIFPDPDKIYASFINKSTMKRNRYPGEENVIKVYSSKSLRKSPQAHTTDDESSFDNLNNDMKGHDFIDNIMYIYYGTNGNLRKDLGGNVIVIGAVFALAPQILTIIILFLRNRRLRHFNAFYPICLNLLLALIASNLSFILGVQATRNVIRCELIALLLHYLHLSTSIWCFIYIYVIYDLLANECSPKLKYHYLMGYGIPAVYVLFSYASSIDRFEVHRYCWMSIQKGMIVSFMVPISFLIILTTVLGTLSLKRISTKQTELLCESIESIIETTSKCNDIIYPRLPSLAGVNMAMVCRSNSYPQLEQVKDRNVCCQEYADCANRHSVVTLPQPNTAGMAMTPGMTTAAASQYAMNATKRSFDCYDTRIDLGQLSLAELTTPSMASDVQDFTEFKKAIKFGLFFQPIFSVCWFLEVIALENVHSCVMPVIFAISFNILNWCMLVRSSNVCPYVSSTMEKTLESQQAASCGESLNGTIGPGGDNDATQASVCTDTIPLLCASNSGSTVISPSSTVCASLKGSGATVATVPRKFSATSVTEEQLQQPLFYSNFIGTTNVPMSWESSIDLGAYHLHETKNADCISTISN